MAKNRVEKVKSGEETEHWGGSPMHAHYEPSSNAAGKRLYVSDTPGSFSAKGYNKPNTSGKAKADENRKASKITESAKKIQKPTPSKQAMIRAIKRDGTRNEASTPDVQAKSKRKLRSDFYNASDAIDMTGISDGLKKKAKDVSSKSARNEKARILQALKKK